MKLNIQLGCKQLVYMFGVIMMVGSVLSGILTPDKRWTEWHFSRLGEGISLSSIIFNLSLIIAAIVMYFFGLEITKNIQTINNISEKVKNRAKNIMGNIFKVFTLCLIVVSTFPFDRFPVIHNIFGYSMLFIFLYICMSINNILPIFSEGFYMFGYSIILISVICYILFLGLNVITLLNVELIMYVLFYIWLVIFTNNVTSNRNIKQ